MSQRFICSHVWIDPSEPPIQRAPYSPVIGSGRREMKPGGHYVCSNCGAITNVTGSLRGLSSRPNGHGSKER